MDPYHVRCKDLRPNHPHAFAKLRELNPFTTPHSAVTIWMDNLPHVPHVHSPGRSPLQQIQPRSSKHSSSIRSCAERSQRHRLGLRTMADNSTEYPAKRGRGRPRGSGVRGGRSRAIDGLRDVVGSAGTGKPKIPPDEGSLAQGDQSSNIPPALVLRPVESGSSASRTASTRSPTRSKAASAVVKKSQLALLTPAIRFVSHETATERGGLPPIVAGLWAKHLFHTLNRSDFIPPGLRVSLYQVDRRGLCSPGR